MVRHVHHDILLAHVWFLKKVPVVSGGPIVSVEHQSARRISVTGRIQGVGFRPFVYRIAHECALTGWVRNETGRVEILVQGSSTNISAFENILINNPPPLAQPQLLNSVKCALSRQDAFIIQPSQAGSASIPVIPPDYFLCDDCLEEMSTRSERRYRYPFINCTQCGPRYTIIDALPYDRPNTAMAGFPLCPACLTEYTNPLDRRFHAQPLACPVCGPTLELHGPDGLVISDNEAALSLIVQKIKEGLTVAVKGIGGYHLICDALNSAAIQRLRDNKKRPHKPLAIMVPMSGPRGLDWLKRITQPTPIHLKLVMDPMRPIVLLPQHLETPLADNIAPGLDEIGVMMPYSPLHHLLLKAIGHPVVATSANISGEPVLTDAETVEQRLGAVTRYFLHHNRPIRRPADDAVFRIIHNKARPIRLGRGIAPVVIPLPLTVPRPVLAVGGQMKNALCLAWNNSAILSPHIGELDTLRGMQVFDQIAHDLQNLFGIHAEILCHDAHPGHDATRWAKQQQKITIPVFHHHAHASALVGEHGRIQEDTLVFTWDGVGLGSDGTLWGGEALLGRPGSWHRQATFRPFRPPGADKAARQPWRSALAVCWEIGQTYNPDPLTKQNKALLRHAWKNSINAPTTSAVGRLFDGASALILGMNTVSYEGQGPICLEAAAHHSSPVNPIALPLDWDEQNALWVTDWAPLFISLLDRQNQDKTHSSMLFHITMAQALLDQAITIRHHTGVNRVGLSGGVFQNRILTELAVTLLDNNGFSTLLHEIVPCNDAGLAFGQLIEMACR
ncbi:MAG: carbamoyltransferase HypF [Magnetococcales bacterium]|nr:carbamoyltransferase HypF [Magnetococcales bacterium]